MKIRNFVIAGLIALAFFITPVATNAQTTCSLNLMVCQLTNQISQLKIQELNQTIANLQQQISALLQQIAQLTGHATGCLPGVIYDPVTGLPCAGNATTTPVSLLTVVSPNGGEGWQRGSYQKITWKYGFEFKITPIEIWLNAASTGGSCPVGQTCPVGAASYLIGKTDTAHSSYGWSVGKALNGVVIPSGAYTVQVRAIDGNGNSLAKDSSDSHFKIYDLPPSNNLPPSISGVSGPTTLNVGQSGTWSVRASDPENGALSYSVIWGDETTAGSGSSGIVQTATFTHTYSRTGTFTPTFTVTDNANQSVRTSLSVAVGGGTVNNGLPRIYGFPAFPSNITVGVPISFNWSASDPDNDNLVWGVDFGEGVGPTPGTCPSNSPQTSFSTSHTYSQSGTYTVTAIVTDCRGGRDTNTFPITISAVPVAIPTITSSYPPNSAIDARSWNGNSYEGVSLNFSGPVSIADIIPNLSIVSSNTSLLSLTPGDFGLKDPDTIGFSFRRNNVFAHVPGERIRITHKPSNSSVCLGFLPGDVNGDGTTSPADQLDLIDALNGVKTLPIYSTDIDRSGVFAPADLLTFIDLLNGGWNGKTLPACPPATTGLLPTNQSQFANSLSALSAILRNLQRSLLFR